MASEVPVLPVVVPTAAAVFLALLWQLRRTNRLSVPRAAVALVLCVYVAGVVANTVFPIFLDQPARSAPWHAYLSLEPLVGYEVADAVTNILVFVPVGVLVPLLVRASGWCVVATAAVFSLSIEVAQFVTALLLGGGHIADVNDLIFNVVGAACGLALLAVLSRVAGVSAFIDRFRWR